MSVFPGLNAEKMRFFVLFNEHASCCYEDFKFDRKKVLKSPEDEETFAARNRAFDEAFSEEMNRKTRPYSTDFFMIKGISPIKGGMREVAISSADAETLTQLFDELKQLGVVSQWREITKEQSAIYPVLSAQAQPK